MRSGMAISWRELGLERPFWRFDDDARGGAVRVQLAVGVDDAPFRRGDAAADVHDLAFAEKQSDLMRERPCQVHLELEGGEAAPGRHQRVDAAAERCIEQRRGI